MIKKAKFLDINVCCLTKKEIIDVLLEFTQSNIPKTVFYLNAHCVNLAFRDPQYKEILNKADLVYPGGQGVVWGSRLSGIVLPERTNILDFFNSLASGLKEKETTIYLLGGRKEVVNGAAQRLKKIGLKIIGNRDGFFDQTQEKEIIREINALKPNILIVGMGVPKQEKWITNHLNELNVSMCWAVGAAFEWLSGYRKRAPAWMIKLGLEWLHRLYQEPKRLWKRYLWGNLVFIQHVLQGLK